MGPREQRIYELVEKAFSPEQLGLENESSHHSVPPGSETHFKLLLVSKHFEGKSRIDRQRLVNELLKGELASGLHALTQKTLTPAEWDLQKDSLNFISPECMGGSKRS